MCMRHAGEQYNSSTTGLRFPRLTVLMVTSFNDTDIEGIPAAVGIAHADGTNAFCSTIIINSY